MAVPSTQSSFKEPTKKRAPPRPKMGLHMWLPRRIGGDDCRFCWRGRGPERKPQQKSLAAGLWVVAIHYDADVVVGIHVKAHLLKSTVGIPLRSPPALVRVLPISRV